MSVEFDESGMHFGPYPDEDCFWIEKCKLYKRIQQGLKIAEFALLWPSNTAVREVWIVEAKSSSPYEKVRLAEYMDEIRQKLTNSIQITLAACLGRHAEADVNLPLGFKALDLKAASFKCVLLINGTPKSELQSLQEALVREMKTVVRTFGLKPGCVLVLNDAQARSKGLIA